MNLRQERRTSKAFFAPHIAPTRSCRTDSIWANLVELLNRLRVLGLEHRRAELAFRQRGVLQGSKPVGRRSYGVTLGGTKFIAGVKNSAKSLEIQRDHQMSCEERLLIVVRLHKLSRALVQEESFARYPGEPTIEIQNKLKKRIKLADADSPIASNQVG